MDLGLLRQWLATYLTVNPDEIAQIVTKISVLFTKISVILGVYVTVYKILQDRYERLAKQAAADRSAMLTPISSADAKTFVFAMRNFAPVQNMVVPPEPIFLKPWRWFTLGWFNKPTEPNREALWSWVRDALDMFQTDFNAGDKFRIDLRRANLKGADLHEVNLSKVDLRNVDLRGADLSKANLLGANLVGANLQEAKLEEANLREANLSGSDLQKAILTNANLSGCILRRAKFRNADLSGVDLSWGNLRLADLTASILENINVRGADFAGAKVTGIKRLNPKELEIQEPTGLSESIQKLAPNGNGRLDITYKIGVSHQAYAFTYTDGLRNSMRVAASKLNVELVEMDALGNVDSELKNVKDMLGDVDCLALDPVSLEGSHPAFEAASNSGVPVIQFNVRANSGEWVTFVGSEQTVSGDLLAQWLIDFHKESATKANQSADKHVIKGIYLRGLEGQVTDIARNYALKARLKRNGYIGRDTSRICIVDEVFANYDQRLANTLTTELLKSYPEIDFIVANNDDMILGALKALEEPDYKIRRAKKEPVALAGVDGLPKIVSLIENGQIAATVFQDAEEQGRQTIEACVEHLKGRKLPKEILIDFKLVTQRNITENMTESP